MTMESVRPVGRSVDRGRPFEGWLHRLAANLAEISSRDLAVSINAGVLAVLTLIFTLPLALDLGHRFLSWLIDPPFNMWTMAWEVHALLADPASMFNANIFFPVQAALAFSSLNFAPMLVAFPIFKFSGNPILAYNLVYLFAWWQIGLEPICLPVEQAWLTVARCWRALWQSSLPSLSGSWGIWKSCGSDGLRFSSWRHTTSCGGIAASILFLPSFSF